MNELLPAAHIGKYVLRRRLGAGGMGEVYAAELVGAFDFRREVAVKLVRPEAGRQDDFRKLFLREGRALAALHHRNVVQVIELGQDGDQLYLVMELLAGTDARQLFQRRGPLPASVALHICAEIAHALAAAHGLRSTEAPKGLVHGDLSLSNVMLGVDGSVKVLDFGLARPAGELSSSTGAAGKVAYLAPEVAAGAPKDALTDLFALGVCVYELISGRLPYRGQTDLETLHALLSATAPPLLEAEPPVRAFVERLLARDRSRRFTSAHEVALEAERLVTDGAGPSMLAAIVTSSTASSAAPALAQRASPVPSAGGPTLSLPLAVEPAQAPARRHGRGLAAGLVVTSIAVGVLVWRLAGPSAPSMPAATASTSPTPEAPPPPPPPEVLPRPARLVVKLDREGLVELDGRVVARGTVAEADLPAGPHRVRVKANGKWLVRDVQLEAGARTVLELQAPRPSARPKRTGVEPENELLDPLKP